MNSKAWAHVKQKWSVRLQNKKLRATQYCYAQLWLRGCIKVFDFFLSPCIGFYENYILHSPEDMLKMALWSDHKDHRKWQNLTQFPWKGIQKLYLFLGKFLSSIDLLPGMLNFCGDFLNEQKFLNPSWAFLDLHHWLVSEQTVSQQSWVFEGWIMLARGCV